MVKKNTSLFHIPAFVFNAMFILALCMSCLANYLKPTVSFPIAFCGMIYPYILLVNILFIVFWLFVRKKYAIPSLLAIGLGFGFTGRLYRLSGRDLPPEKQQCVKIMSYNVQAFGGFNRQKKQDIIEFINRQQPDILCLQEYWLNTAEKGASSKKIIYPYQSLYLPLSNYRHRFGIALFSKYPVIGEGHIDFSNSHANAAQFADIVINGDTVRVYNIHLQSMRFGKQDYDFASLASEPYRLSQTQIKEGGMRILRKIKHGFAKRVAQVETVIKHIAASPYKVIICGDFNDTPWSYTYAQFADILQDAFIESGKGTGNTMFINRLLSFRIDYIYHDKGFKSYAFATESFASSDHYPISVFVDLDSTSLR
jgi:endonuclease/exonuclease/phosphatase family metal-dependent hydrolase